MVALLSVLVLDGHGVVAGILSGQMPDGQRAISPITAALEERLKR